MLRNSERILLSMLLIPTLTGCKYDGSFMQMDSNSGFPFFGLTLAVDSGSRPPEPSDTRQSGNDSAFNLKLHDSQTMPFEAHDGDDKTTENSALVRVSR